MVLRSTKLWVAASVVLGLLLLNTSFRSGHVLEEVDQAALSTTTLLRLGPTLVFTHIVANRSLAGRIKEIALRHERTVPGMSEACVVLVYPVLAARIAVCRARAKKSLRAESR